MQMRFQSSLKNSNHSELVGIDGKVGNETVGNRKERVGTMMDGELIVKHLTLIPRNDEFLMPRILIGTGFIIVNTRRSH